MIFPSIKETRWKNKSDSYSLFNVINEIISDMDNPVVKYRPIRIDLVSFSEKITSAASKENKTKKFPRNILNYMNAVTKSTTDKDRRIMRHKILMPILRKYISN